MSPAGVCPVTCGPEVWYLKLQIEQTFDSMACMSDGVATLEREGTPPVDPDAEVCEIAGILNVANARLVAVVETVLADDSWQGPGVHTPAQWLACKAGISPERAKDIIRIAARRSSFPSVVGVFDAGQLSVEQVAVAVKAPEWADADIVDFARLATVTQLRRKIRDEEFAGDPDQPAPTPIEPKDRVSFGATGNGRWRLNANLDVATGSRVEAALTEAKDSLFEDDDEHVTWPDALVEVAERSLDAVPSDSRRDRYRTWLHLDVTNGAATTTEGWRIPMAIADRLTCDGVVQPVWEQDGVPFSVGRTQRVVPERTRRAVQRRDRGCRVPGCTHDRIIEIHHIIHWTDNGPTDTWNLCALCPHHHRLHHQGLLGISGNADLPDGLVFTDVDGNVIEPAGTPTVTGEPPPQPDIPYRQPYGGRLDYNWIGLGWVHPNELEHRRQHNRAHHERLARWRPPEGHGPAP